MLARDGRFVAKGNTNGTVRVWEVERGTVRELSTKPGMTRPLAFLAQGGALIFEHGDNSISQWDFATGKETELWQPRNRVRSRALSPDEHWFVAIGLDGTSILRNQSTLTQTNFGLNLEQSNDASFSPDGKTVAAISWTGIGKVWAVESAGNWERCAGSVWESIRWHSRRMEPHRGGRQRKRSAQIF